MAEEKKAVRVKRSFWKPMQWRQEYYRRLAGRLILWLGCAFIVACAALGISNVVAAHLAARFAIVAGFLVGTLTGSLGIVLLMNRREGQEMAKRDAEKE